MFHGVGLYRPAHGYYRRQARHTSDGRGYQPASGGDDQPGPSAHHRAGDGGDAARGGGERQPARLDHAGGERRLFHGRPYAVQGEPRAGHLLRGGGYPGGAPLPEGGGPVRDRVDLAGRHDRQDARPDLLGAPGVARQDLHRLLPGAGAAGERDLRADAQRPGDRRRGRGVDHEGDRVL